MRYEIKLERIAVLWSLKTLWDMGKSWNLSWGNDKPLNSFEGGMA